MEDSLADGRAFEEHLVAVPLQESDRTVGNACNRRVYAPGLSAGHPQTGRDESARRAQVLLRGAEGSPSS